MRAEILLIDDDPDIRAMVHGTLEDAGHAVTDAADGNQGLRCVAHTAYDLVITDLVMPEREGLETIMELKQMRPGIKMIAISGGLRNSEVDFLAIAKRLGARRTLTSRSRFGR